MHLLLIILYLLLLLLQHVLLFLYNTITIVVPIRIAIRIAIRITVRITITITITTTITITITIIIILSKPNIMNYGLVDFMLDFEILHFISIHVNPILVFIGDPLNIPFTSIHNIIKLILQWLHFTIPIIGTRLTSTTINSPIIIRYSNRNRHFHTIWHCLWNYYLLFNRNRHSYRFINPMFHWNLISHRHYLSYHLIQWKMVQHWDLVIRKYWDRNINRHFHCLIQQPLYWSTVRAQLINYYWRCLVYLFKQWITLLLSKFQTITICLTAICISILPIIVE